jgi:hypothetical protein
MKIKELFFFDSKNRNPIIEGDSGFRRNDGDRQTKRLPESSL